MHDQTTAETRDSAKPVDDQTGEVALRERISSAADHCRNALQMLLGLRLLADKVASLPGNLLQPWFSQDLRILADSLERRLSQAVEELEGAWVPASAGQACPLLPGLARSSTYATVTRVREGTNGYYDRACEGWPDRSVSNWRYGPGQETSTRGDGGGGRVCQGAPRAESTASDTATGAEAAKDDLSAQSLADGQQIFRFATFGDEQFWTDTLHLNEVVEKAVDPTTALKVGLKVDADVLPPGILQKVDLKSPATTVALLKMNAVVGRGRGG